MSDNFTFEDIWHDIAPSAAYRVYRQYREFVDPYALGTVVLDWLEDNAKQIERLLYKQPQRISQIQRELEDAARAYCERRKAEKSGYSIDDVYWYTPGLVDQLKPMAMKPDWKPTDETLDQGDGKPRRSKPAREGGDLQAMVMDVRRAAKLVGWGTNSIVEYLGGRRPKGLVA